MKVPWRGVQASLTNTFTSDEVFEKLSCIYTKVQQEKKTAKHKTKE